jgi:hypothetical protein
MWGLQYCQLSLEFSQLARVRAYSVNRQTVIFVLVLCYWDLFVMEQPPSPSHFKKKEPEDGGNNNVPVGWALRRVDGAS